MKKKIEESHVLSCRWTVIIIIIIIIIIFEVKGG